MPSKTSELRLYPSIHSPESLLPPIEKALSPILKVSSHINSENILAPFQHTRTPIRTYKHKGPEPNDRNVIRTFYNFPNYTKLILFLSSLKKSVTSFQSDTGALKHFIAARSDKGNGLNLLG